MGSSTQNLHLPSIVHLILKQSEHVYTVALPTELPRVIVAGEGFEPPSTVPKLELAAVVTLKKL